MSISAADHIMDFDEQNSMSKKRSFDDACCDNNYPCKYLKLSDWQARKCADRDKNNNNNNNNKNDPPTPKKETGPNHPDINNRIPLIFFLNEFNRLDNNDNSEDLDFDDTNPNTNTPTNCTGPFCDHDPESANVRSIPDKLLSNKNKYTVTLDDLIELGTCYHCKLQRTFKTISLEKLSKLVIPLKKLNSMIGMGSIKKDFVEQIVCTIQGFEKNSNDFLHTILEGPPGVGKTHVVDILAEIYIAMGYMSKKIIKKVRRSDLIGKYLGHTADKTQKAIDAAAGGILLIDEAYSLGNDEKKDSFSKECIDTINQNLTEQADKFICIIVGYERELNKCFFSYNPGLRGRFKHTYTIKGYNPSELEEIFDLKVKTDEWKIDPTINKKAKENFFTKNMESFEYFGRSMESLFFHTKIAHSNRVFWDQTTDGRKILTMSDIEKGFERFVAHSKNSVEDIPHSVKHIYT